MMIVMMIVTLIWLTSLTAIAWTLIKKTERQDAEIDNLQTCLAKLAEIVAELKEDEPDDEKKSKQYLQDYVDTVVNYSPFGER